MFPFHPDACSLEVEIGKGICKGVFTNFFKSLCVKLPRGRHIGRCIVLGEVSHIKSYLESQYFKGQMFNVVGLVRRKHGQWANAVVAGHLVTYLVDAVEDAPPEML